MAVYNSAIKGWSTSLSGLAAVLFCSLFVLGQDVQVAPGKQSVGLTISASKSYRLLGTEEKQPTLTLECAQKGGKGGHLLLFSPGGAITEDDPETAPKNGQLVLAMTIAGAKQTTTWIPYGDTTTFAYYGRTEPERLKFIQELLKSPTASIQFKPFLTGQLVTSEFDVSKLRDEAGNHPECGLK